MKRKLTIIGTVIATMAFATVNTWAQDAAPKTSTSAPGVTTTTDQENNTEIVGRLDSLFRYLSVGSPEGSVTTHEVTSEGTSKLTAGKARSEVESVGTFPRSDAIGTQSLGGPVTGQPLVLIASGDQRPTAAGLPHQRPSPKSTGSIVQGSSAAADHQVYVLVFDPQNPASRLAYGKARGLLAGGTTGKADKAPARPTTESPKGLEKSEKDSDRAGSRPDPSTRNPAEIGNAKSGTQANPAPTPGNTGAMVRITGKVLSKGGLQAIEVEDIEAVRGWATTGGGHN